MRTRSRLFHLVVAVAAVGALTVGAVGAGAQDNGALVVFDWDGPMYEADTSTAELTAVADTEVPSIVGADYYAAGHVIYLVTYEGDASELYSVDPDTGASTLIGPLGTPDAPTALAADPATGTIYVAYDTADSNLATLSPSTGAATDIGPIAGDAAGERIGGLAFHPTTGVLYAGGYDGTLYTLNTATGVATEAFVMGEQSLGLAFDPTGLLYSVDWDELFVIDVDAETTTLVGPLVMPEGSEANAWVGEFTPPPDPPVIGPGTGGGGSGPAAAVTAAPAFTG